MWVPLTSVIRGMFPEIVYQYQGLRLCKALVVGSVVILLPLRGCHDAANIFALLDVLSAVGVVLFISNQWPRLRKFSCWHTCDAAVLKQSVQTLLPKGTFPPSVSRRTPMIHWIFSLPLSLSLSFSHSLPLCLSLQVNRPLHHASSVLNICCSDICFSLVWYIPLFISTWQPLTPLLSPPLILTHRHIHWYNTHTHISIYMHCIYIDTIIFFFSLLQANIHPKAHTPTQ